MKWQIRTELGPIIGSFQLYRAIIVNKHVPKHLKHGFLSNEREHALRCLAAALFEHVASEIMYGNLPIETVAEIDIVPSVDEKC